MSTSGRPAAPEAKRAQAQALHAFEVDDERTIYAATSAIHAANLYTEDTGNRVERGYPRQLSEAELDTPRAELDEDERLTGRTTTIRQWLVQAAVAGYLGGANR